MSAVGKPDLSFLPRLQALAHNPTLGIQALAPQEAKEEKPVLSYFRIAAGVAALGLAVLAYNYSYTKSAVAGLGVAAVAFYLRNVTTSVDTPALVAQNTAIHDATLGIVEGLTALTTAKQTTLKASMDEANFSAEDNVLEAARGLLDSSVQSYNLAHDPYDADEFAVANSQVFPVAKQFLDLDTSTLPGLKVPKRLADRVSEILFTANLFVNGYNRALNEADTEYKGYLNLTLNAEKLVVQSWPAPALKA